MTAILRWIGILPVPTKMDAQLRQHLGFPASCKNEDRIAQCLQIDTHPRQQGASVKVWGSGPQQSCRLDIGNTQKVTAPTPATTMEKYLPVHGGSSGRTRHLPRVPTSSYCLQNVHQYLVLRSWSKRRKTRPQCYRCSRVSRVVAFLSL